MREFLAILNVSLWLLNHKKSFLVLSSKWNGASSVPTVYLVHVDNWLTKPMEDCRLMQLVGVGYLEIASVINWLIWYPSAESWKPVKVTWVWKNLHLSMLQVMFLSMQRCKNCFTYVGDVVFHIAVINNYVCHPPHDRIQIVLWRPLSSSSCSVQKLKIQYKSAIS